MTFIYKLYRDDTKEMYIGSTNNIKKRFNHHKTTLRYASKKLFEKDDNVKIVVLEECEEEKRYEREQYYMDLNKEFLINEMNAIRVGTEQERSKRYYNQHKEEVLERQRKHRQDNLEMIRKREKKWREDNKEKEKERFKKYRQTEKGKESARERKRRYREKNRKEENKITCECGAVINREELARHKKTKRHLDKISQLSINGNCETETINEQTKKMDD
jgi:hypothetical protein